MKLAAYKNNQLISSYETPELSSDDSFEVFIGRSEDCHLQIDDPQVSREHAIILFENNRWTVSRLTDIGTVIINGESVHERQLAEGESLHFGPFVVEVTGLQSKSESIPDKPVPEISEPVETVEEPIEEEATVIEESTESSEEVEASGEADEFAEEGAEEPVAAEESLEGDFTDGAEGGADGFGDGFAENTESEVEFGDPIDAEGGALPEEGGFEDAGDGDSTIVFSNFASYELEIFGEHAPYDRFIIEDNEVLIGRSQEKCQIALDDHEVSTIHAKLKKTKINLLLEDQNSTNGTILNGARINQSELNNGDEFIIGSTAFTVRVRSEMLDEEEEILMPVEENQQIEVEASTASEASFDAEEGEGGFQVAEGGDFGVDSALVEQSIFKNPEKRKKLIYGTVVVLLAWVLLDDGEKPKTAAKGKESEAKEAATKTGAAKPQEQVRILSPEEKEYVASHYRLGKAYALKGDYARALEELELVREVDPTYESTESLYLQSKEGLAELERLEKERKEQERRAKIKAEVKKLIADAREAFKEDKLSLVDTKIGQILERDPENVEVQELKMEVEAVKEERQRKKLAEEEKKKRREDMVALLSPGKNFYLKEEWFKAIIKLQQFLDKKSMDEDLIKDATRMLNESKDKLNSVVEPLLGKARALKEGQDLKGAYEAYNEVLSVDPSNEESLNEMASIRGDLEDRAKKIYREALISESLSLFNEAKEKFQEVQQVSPSDSAYYEKATMKLKEYID